MDTSKLNRSPAAMRPLPRTRSASDAMMPAGGGGGGAAAPSAKPGLSSVPAGRPDALRLPGPSTAACRSRKPASRSGRRQACASQVPGPPPSERGRGRGSSRPRPSPRAHVILLALPPRRRAGRRTLPARLPNSAPGSPWPLRDAG